MKNRTLLRRFVFILYIIFLNCGLNNVMAGENDIVLKKDNVVLKSIGSGDNVGKYDTRIEVQKVKLITAYFSKKVIKPQVRVYFLQDCKGYYIVVAKMKEKSEAGYYYPWCMYLVRENPDGSFDEVGKTGGAGDSYMLKPNFYAGGGKIFIFAETGSEYSWGYMVYEVRNKRLFEYGNLDVADENGDSGPTTVVPSKVKYTKGKLVVEFHASLVNSPGSKNQSRISKSGTNPTVFESDGKEFVIIQK